MQFDEYAAEYDALLERGLKVTGEPKEYYARVRLRFAAACLKRLGARPIRVLDYGCGTGSTVPIIREELAPSEIVGFDPSAESVGIATARFGDDHTRFVSALGAIGTGFDFVYCNGVFHHIDRAQRGNTAAIVMRMLRPGGLFGLWENNAWNPGTRMVMRRVAFDHDAVPLRVTETRRLLREAGFDVLRHDFLFIFPRYLARLRWMEPILTKLPLGGQYQVLACRPA